MEIINVIIIIFTVITILGVLYFLNDDGFKVSDNPANVCILLTCAVNNDPERLSIYVDRINKYLNDNIDLYVVESSGYDFPEFKDRIKIHTFVGKKTSNSSEMEVDSINRIIEYYSLYNYDIILKITGKYYIPNLKYIISLIDKKHELVLQNTTYLSSQNSEIFGCKPHYFKKLDVKNNNFENAIPLLNTPGFRLPKIKLNEFTKRGDGSILKVL